MVKIEGGLRQEMYIAEIKQAKRPILDSQQLWFRKMETEKDVIPRKSFI